MQARNFSEPLKPQPLDRVMSRLLLLRLFAPSLVMILVALVLVGYLWDRVLGDQRLQLARSLAHSVESFIDHGDRVLHAVTLAVDSQDADLENRYLEAAWRAYGYFDTMYRLDTKGRIAALVPYDSRYLGMDLSRQPFFQKAAGRRGVTISEPFTSLRTGKPTVSIARPSQEGGVMVGELNLGALQDAIEVFHSNPNQTQVFVADHAGTLLAHPQTKLVDQQVNVGHLAIVHQGLEGQVSLWQSTEKGLLLSSAVPVRGLGWVVVVQMTLASFLRPFWTVVGPAIVLTLLIWAAMVLALRRQVQRHVTRPVSDLAQVAKRISGGELQLSAKVEREDEIGALARAFNVMTLQLRRRIELENLVAGISRNFMGLPSSQLERGMDLALQSMGRFVEADRCFVYLLPAESSQEGSLRQWPASPTAGFSRQDPFPPQALVRWAARQPVNLVSLDNLPPGSDSMEQFWRTRGVKSVLCLHMGAGGTVGGLMGFESLQTERAWSSEDLRLLQVVGEIFYHGLVRRDSEIALKRAEEKYRGIFENAAEGMFQITLEGRFLSANPSLARIYGYESVAVLLENLTHVPSQLCRDPEDWERFLEAVLEEGEVHDFLMEVVRGDGSRAINSVSARAVRDALGRFSHLEGSVEDVTERQQAERALQISERRYRDLFSSISDFIYTHDLQGRFLSVNPAIAAALGLPAEQILGRTVSSFMREEYRQAFERDYLDKVKREGQARGISIYRRVDGKETYAEYRSTLVGSLDQEEPYVSGSGRDVTERVMAEREMKKLEGKLQQAQKMEAIGILAGGVAHDFNNILQVIAGYLQLLVRSPQLGEKERAHLDHVDLAVDRASGLVRQLLTFSRSVEPKLRPMDLNQEIQVAVALLERTIPKMISIQTRLSPDLMLINGDPSQLEQVLLNLGANARDAMPQGGSLVIETQNVVLDQAGSRDHVVERPGSFVLLKVSDTGQGMDPKALEHIFDPFYTTKAVGEGTGLGLSTTYGIIKSHGGGIECTSAPGRGTSFSIYLPARQEAADALETSVAPPASGRARGTGQVILVVDDESQIVSTVSEALVQSGFAVLSASSGEEALKVYGENQARVALVVLDLGMPGMGGKACLRELRRINPQARVLVASGYATDTQAQEVLREGASAFLPKPYRLDQLLDAVGQIFRG